MCSACWADGRATITTDASSTIISCAIAITASDSHRRGSGPSASWGSVEVRALVAIGLAPGRGQAIIGVVVPVLSELYGAFVPFVNTQWIGDGREPPKRARHGGSTTS